MFRKKSKKEYQDKANTLSKERSVDKLVFKEITKDSDVNEVCISIKKNFPVIINLEELDIDEANKSLAYICGFVDALDGEYIKITDTKYLFTKKEEFLDGSLKEFLEEIQ